MVINFLFSKNSIAIELLKHKLILLIVQIKLCYFFLLRINNPVISKLVLILLNHVKNLSIEKGILLKVSIKSAELKQSNPYFTGNRNYHC